MARIRTIKPEFFRHEILFDAEEATKLPLRLAFCGLLTVVDREGRFRWRPRSVKPDVLPYDNIDFAAVLDALADTGLVRRYEVDGENYGVVLNFSKHQRVNAREAQSTIPDHTTHVQARASTKTIVGNRKGKGKGIGRGRREGVTPAASPNTKGTRWPVGGEVTAGWINDGEDIRSKHGLPPTNLALEAEKFANYWTAQSGATASKKDWHKTWLNWVLNAKTTNGNGKESPFEKLDRVSRDIIREYKEETGDHGAHQRPLVDILPASND